MTYFTSNTGIGDLIPAQIGGDPISDSHTGYTRWPIKRALAADAGIFVPPTVWTGERWLMPFCSRSSTGWNQKPADFSPNTLVAGKDARMMYSSIVKADAAGLCQELSALGAAAYDEWENGYVDIALRAGFAETDVIPYSVWQSDSSLYFPDDSAYSNGLYRVGMDKILLQPSSWGEAVVGVMLDYEVQDGHTWHQSLENVAARLNAAKKFGKKTGFWTNTFNAPTQAHTQITRENVPAIFGMCDIFYIMLWRGTPSFPLDPTQSWLDQLDYFRGNNGLGIIDINRIGVMFDLNTCTEEDAWFVRGLIMFDGLKHVYFWPNTSNMTTTDPDHPTNRKIGIICHGTTPGL